MIDKSQLGQEYLDKVETIAEHHEEDRKEIYDAFEYALEAHGDQKRKSGEPYIIHPI